MRRASHEALTKAEVQRYRPVQIKEANILVTSLLTNPEDRQKHFMRAGASTIMAILYNYPTLASVHDKAIEDVEKNLHWSKQAAAFGSFLVDSFPWMLYIPQGYRHSPTSRSYFP